VVADLPAILATIPNQWDTPKHQEDGCYWCNPERFPAMPEDHSLCSRCGALIYLRGIDPFNEGMALCPQCNIDVVAEWESVSTQSTEGDQK
jgi:uncharacterized paraquat-inducible protein A